MSPALTGWLTLTILEVKFELSRAPLWLQKAFQVGNSTSKSMLKSGAKPMKRKAYLIIHDGTDILIGSGGSVYGNNRNGWHLPGGTVDKKDTSPDIAAERELKEETGITLNLSGTTKTEFKITSGNTEITFIVVKVLSVSALIANRAVPIATGGDQPFTSVDAKSIIDCLAAKGKEFSSVFWTDWFIDGIEMAQNSSLLK